MWCITSVKVSLWVFVASTVLLVLFSDCENPWQHRRRKLLGLAGCCSPTFWPLWAAPISGPATFDSWGPRQSVKDTTIVSLSGYPPDGFFGIQILQNSISDPPMELTMLPQAAWGGGYFLPILHLHRRRWCMTGPPTIQMLLPPMLGGGVNCVSLFLLFAVLCSMLEIQ